MIIARPGQIILHFIFFFNLLVFADADIQGSRGEGEKKKGEK